MRLDQLGDTEGGLDADGELGVVEGGEDSVEVLPEVLLVRPLQPRLGESAEDLKGLSDGLATDLQDWQRVCEDIPHCAYTAPKKSTP